MNPRAKNYLIVLLAFSTITAGVIAWQQTRRLKTLETTLLTPRPAPARPVAMVKPAAATTEPAPAETKPSAAITPPADTARPPQRNNRFNLAALMGNPEIVKAWNLQQRSQLDARFAGLFKQLNLSPEQLENFKTLLVERQTSAMDVFATAREKGLNFGENRAELQKMVTDAQADIDQNIRASLGDTAYQQYQNYQSTQAQRTVVSQLEQRLSYTSAPLTGPQADFLVQALGPPASVDTTANPFGWPGGRGGGGAPITDAVIQRAQGVLMPTQVDALRQLKAEQDAQQRLGQLVRGAMGNGN